MSFASSVNYYFDLLNSTFCHSIVSGWEIQEISEKLQRAYDEYCQKQNELDACWDSESLTEREINALDAQSCQKFHTVLEKIDILLSLHLYVASVDPKAGEDIWGSLADKLKANIEHEHKRLILTEQEHELRKRLEGWRKVTEIFSYSCDFTNSTFKDFSSLVRQTHKAKIYCSNVSELRKETGSFGPEKIYPLYEQCCFRGVTFPSTTLVATWKGCSLKSRYKDIALAIAAKEALMYRISAALGFSSFFVPVEAQTISTQDKVYVGSIKPFMRGRSFSEALENYDDDIADEDYVDFTIASLVMSTQAAEAENIILDKSECPILWDSRFSLSDARNGLVYSSKGELMPAYHNSLLVLPQAFDSLVEEHSKRIQGHLDRIQGKMEFFMDEALEVLREQGVKVSPKVNLWKIQHMIGERLEAMKKSLATTETFIDFVFEVDPMYKFLTSLRVACCYSERGDGLFVGGYPKKPLNPVDMSELLYHATRGVKSVDAILDDCLRCGINPKEIFERVYKSDFSSMANWVGWIHNILGYVEAKRVEGHQQIETIFDGVDEILNRLHVMARGDHFAEAAQSASSSGYCS